MLPEIHFWESVSIGVGTVEEELGPDVPAVFSVGTENESDKTIRIVRLEPVADEGLHVEYLGHATCRRGCAGAQNWIGDTPAQVRRGLEGFLPITLRAGERQESLTFRLTAIDPHGVETLKTRCLRLRAVKVWLEDGSVAVMRSSANEFFLAGIEPPEPRPNDYLDCRRDES